MRAIFTEVLTTGFEHLPTQRAASARVFPRADQQRVVGALHEVGVRAAGSAGGGGAVSGRRIAFKNKRGEESRSQPAVERAYRRTWPWSSATRTILREARASWLHRPLMRRSPSAPPRCPACRVALHERAPGAFASTESSGRPAA